MLSLSFYSCALDAEGVDALAKLSCDDALPALRSLAFHNTPDITDVGVVVLTDDLLKALQTSLSTRFCTRGSSKMSYSTSRSASTTRCLT